jgi:hypothetical protein
MISISCNGQINSNKILSSNKLIKVENLLFQYSKGVEKDTVVVSSLWDEFNDNSEDRIPIPGKIVVKTLFHINTEWAGEKIPLDKTFFKTTIQFVYGNIVIGGNISNPSFSEEIQLLNSSFTGKDFEKMFLNSSDFSGLIYESPTFLLRDYLIKNKVSLFDFEGKSKVLGRIVIRTYFGNKHKFSNMCENIINVMKNPYIE